MPRTLPRPDKIIARWRAESITGVANGGSVMQWVDDISGLIMQAPAGHEPVFVTGDGTFSRPAVRFVNGRRLILPTSPAITAALGWKAGTSDRANYKGGTWHLSYRRPQAQKYIHCYFGGGGHDTDIHAPGFMINGYGGGNDYENPRVSAGGNSSGFYTGTFFPPDPHGDVVNRVQGITGNVLSDINLTGGKALYNGTKLAASYTTPWDETTALALGACGDIGNNSPNADFADGNDVEIEELIIYSEALPENEAMHLYYYSCEADSQPDPMIWSGAKRFVVFNGDSQTENNFPDKYAAYKGLPYGTFTNVGKSGYQLGPGDSDYPNNDVSYLARWDTDGYSEVTGFPTLLVVGEYYNRGSNDDDVGGGGSDNLLAQNTAFNARRKADNPSTRLVWWTSLASWDRDGGGRDHYNDKLTNVAGHYGADRVVPIHLDPNIGVHGAAPTTSNGTNTYFADGIHLNFSAGTDKMVELLGPAIDEELARPYVTQITGPATAGFGTGPVTLTVGIDAPADKDITINIVRTGAAGILSATSLVIQTGEQYKTVTFTPSAIGVASFTTTNDDNLYNGSYALGILQITFTPPSAFQHWLPTNMSVAITSGLAAGVDIMLSDNDAGGTFTPEAVSVTPGHLAAGFTYLAAQAAPVTITASAAGYQPVSVTVPVVDPGPIDGDGAYAAFPAPLTAAIPIDPAGDPLIAMPFDPSDARRVKADFTIPLAGKTIASLKGIGFDDAAGALGWRISVGYDRPILDKANNCVVARVECDPAFAQVAAYSGSGFVAAPRAQIETTDGELIERSFPFATRQL